MSTIAQVATAIATTVKGNSDLRAVEFMAADMPSPAAMVRVPNIERGSFRSAAGSLTVFPDFELYVYTQTLFERAGQKALMDYADPSLPGSVWRALDDQPDVGLGDVSCGVVRCRFIGVEEVSAFGYFCAVFDIAVSASSGA